MAATPLPITELDFESIKEQLKNYLRSQTQFKDYNFEGSNMSVLLDVLAYNTYQNNFYTSMAINEMFLDSAILQSSIISHAKELNYLPRSRKSARAIVKVTIVDSTGELTGQQTVTIPQYADFVTTYQGQNFNFVTNQSYIAKKTAPGIYVAENVEIYEGQILSSFEREGYIVDADGILRVFLSNPEVDIDSVEVFVDAEQTDDQNTFTYAKDIFGVGPEDRVFYIEPYFDNRYSIYFGNNVYGVQPTPAQDVRVRYRVTSGAEANGATGFSTSFLENVTITVETVSPAVGGAERESLESIRFFAPRSIQIQERAITTNDYEILLKQRFPEITAVAAYGGDELDPPQFGKVAISVYLDDNTQLISNTLSNSYIEYLKDKTPLTIEPIFVQTEFVYADITVKVYYSRKLTQKSSGKIESLVRAAIQNYSDVNLENFNRTLRLSKLSASIDDVDNSIQSNSIEALPIIEYSPPLNIAVNPIFKFGSKLIRPYAFKESNGFTNYKPTVFSSVFDQDGVCVYLQDDGLGNIQVITDDLTNPQVVNPRAGTVNYETGDVKLINFVTESFTGSAIKIMARTFLKDITSPKGRVFIIRDEDVKVEVYQIETSV